VPVEDENFAANLKALREAAGLTQTALAEAMARRRFRWHQATVYKIENSERQIQLSEAMAVADVLGVPLGALTRAPVSSEQLRLSTEAAIERAGAAKGAIELLAESLKKLAVEVGRARNVIPDSPDVLRAEALLETTWHTELVMPLLTRLGFRITDAGPELPEQTLARIAQNAQAGREDDSDS
jgi:transcriptional regulator with XRE-family HTH domain